MSHVHWHRGQRAKLLFVLIGLGTVLMLNVRVFNTIESVTVKRLAQLSPLPIVVISIACWIMREKLLKHTFNRRIAAALLVGLTALMAHRVLAYASGETRVFRVLSDDAFILAAVSALGAFTIVRWMLWLSLILAAGAVGIVLWPNIAMTLSTALPMVAVAVALHSLRRARNAPKPTGG